MAKSNGPKVIAVTGQEISPRDCTPELLGALAEAAKPGTVRTKYGESHRGPWVLATIEYHGVFMHEFRQAYVLAQEIDSVLGCPQLSLRME